MKRNIGILLTCIASIAPIAVAHSAGVPLPGDHAPMAAGPGGGPGPGPGAGGGAGAGPAGGAAGPGAPRPAGPPPQRTPDPVAASPSMALALRAAQAIATACKQYPMALAVVDSEGVAKLIYVPDGSAAWHGYSAVRKAYTAITFKSDTSKVIKQAATDSAIMDKFKADPNLTRQSGGLLLMAGDKIVGGIGVSGAEPGGHDEECGLAGRAVIQDDLK